jgi:chorismate lyase
MTGTRKSAGIYFCAMNFPPSEPRWVSRQQLSLLHPGHAQRQLLTSSGSLTKKIIQHCDGAFSVEVLSQQFAPLRHTERTRLRLQAGQLGNIRTVRLHCNQHPWVFAHTVIPYSALRRSLRRLTQLGSRSLGAVLHRSRVMERSHVEYARFQPQHTLYQQATAHLKQPPKVLWGRRILYRIDGNPLLVHELFLPEFNQ